MPPATQANQVEDRRKLPRQIRRVLWILLAWDNATTRALVGTACFDCHSHQTQWYWYTNVAPFSWLIQRDVEEGRAVLNFSEWDRPQEADEVAESIREGSMPPWYYYAVHWAAKLSSNEQEQLIAGLQRTFQASPPSAEDD